MYAFDNENVYRVREWEIDKGEDIEKAKKEVFPIINKYKIPLSKVRCLFIDILRDIEDKNIISL